MKSKPMERVLRNLKADLALCEGLSPGPWKGGVVNEEIVLVSAESTYERMIRVPDSKEDAKFIIAAREGWPEAIRRAMAAEAECDELRAALLELTNVWLILLGRARRVLGGERG